MIKKYKKQLMHITISIILLLIVGVITNIVIAATFNPSEKDFLTSRASSLLGKNIASTTLYNTLETRGNLACFYHKEGGSGVNSTIHSVFDIGFDETKGEIKVYSVMKTKKSTTEKTTYASDYEKNNKGVVTKSGKNIGLLAANTEKTKNAYKVWEALKIAIADKAVVNESAIVGGVSAWGGNDLHGGSGDLSIKNLSNPATDSRVSEYQNYRKINKENTDKEAKEIGKEITLNNKAYTVIGPFKISLGGKNITDVSVANASWNKNNKEEIYWLAAIDVKEDNWSAGWTNDFNKKIKKNSKTYYINNKSFYLAVQTDKLPDVGTYSVSINQAEFSYNKSRIVVTVGNKAQQMGMYCYDSTPTTVKGNVSWNLTRNSLKTLVINKKDSSTNAELTGATFKIYAELNDGTKGWVSGSVDGAKTYGENATEYLAKVEIKNLKIGTYYIYETKAPDGYDLVNQSGYHQAANGSTSLTGDWVYLGKRTLVNSDATVTVAITNKVSPKVEIIKKDNIKNNELEGAKFKLYAILDDGTKGWVSGSANGSKTFGENADEYDSNTNIAQLKYGTYYIYETKMPEGYDATKQDGYHKEAEGSSALTGDWVYLGTKKLDINNQGDGTFKFEAFNKKIVSDLEGLVWIDQPDTKENATDNIYKSSTKDELKAGVTVNLYDGNNNMIATTKTDSNGRYKFTTKNASSYTGEDKNIYYWDLEDAYVEFIYNNKTTYNEDGTVKEYGYATVDTLVGTDASVNSKAQEYTVTTEQLDDNNLTGTQGENPGRAVTNKQAVKLTNYYDNATYKVTNINLGLLEKHDPSYSVDENLAYIKVKMKGYTYTYKYGDAAATTSTNVPTVNEQNSTKTFTGKIYPTDIAYNIANQNDELKVYVVYSIDVKNLETMYVDNIYTEERLYLDSLVNTYDTERYQLCNNENNEDKSDFALWKDDGNGKASYDVNNEKSVYKNGMAKQETKTSYIQYRVKDEALRKILEKKLTNGDIEQAPTLASATGYHEYLRTDNAWVHNNDVRAFTGVKGLNVYPTTNDAQRKYYVHKSISKERSSSALYLRLSLGDARKLSGTVFEDTKTEESEKENTNLGNGILDSNEANRAQSVTVELLNADKATVSKLYQEKDGKVVYNADGSLPDARIETEVGGTYEFEGIVPGYYYIRFTYGDGTQKMMPAGTEIKSNDYKSTIINTEANGASDTIKNAIETSQETLNSIREVLPTNQTDAQKKVVEWYKYLNNNNYSTAVDDLTQRSQTNGYKYTDDGKVYDATGKEIENYKPGNVNAYTPMASISIENDVNTSTDEGDVHKSDYSGFNLGIIETSKTTLTPEKKITDVKLTTQAGTTLVDANPTDKSAKYITALDKVTGGSKYAKMEIDKDLIYGSSVETTYQITIKNESEKDYVEDEGTDEYGHYYYYGEITKTHPKSVQIENVIDELDSKYNLTPNTSEANGWKTSADGKTSDTTVTITKNNEGTETTTNNVNMTGWESLTSGESESVSYTVTSLLSSDNSMDYKNNVKIQKVSLDQLSTLKSNFEWGKDKTVITISEPTGGDRRPVYWIAGTVGLIVLATGIVLIKKKLLNK